MLQRVRHSSIYALVFAALLIAVQGYAQIEQWRQGFRLFRAAPLRVPLSWDMFAVEIERCGLSWDPPSFWWGRPLRELHEFSAPIEWDPVYNRRADYISAAALACAYREPGFVARPDTAAPQGTFKVHCFVAHGEETQDEFSCPKAR